MQSRPYYFVGEQLLTQSYRAFMQPYDIALYDEHPITTSRIRGAVNNAALEVNESLEALRKFQAPIYGYGWEDFEKPTYRAPIFTAFIPDSKHLQSQCSGCYTVQRKNVVIHEVKVCGESYTSAFYPSAYRTLVNTGSSNGIVEGIRNLFRDYSHPRFGLFLTLHWNRHYRALADEIVRDLPAAVQGAYDYLLSHRCRLIDSDKTSMTGSFMRRLDYAIGQLITEMNKTHEPVLRAQR